VRAGTRQISACRRRWRLPARLAAENDSEAAVALPTLDNLPDSVYKPAMASSAIAFLKMAANRRENVMAYDKEDQGDENEFVHFEEEELGGDPEEVIEEESEEELVITERPGAAAPQPPVAAPKPAARKKAAKKPAKKAKKKAAPKKAKKKKAAKKSAKRGKRR
jgi:hypothetical protein